MLAFERKPSITLDVAQIYSRTHSRLSFTQINQALTNLVEQEMVIATTNNSGPFDEPRTRYALASRYAQSEA